MGKATTSKGHGERCLTIVEQWVESFCDCKNHQRHRFENNNTITLVKNISHLLKPLNFDLPSLYYYELGQQKTKLDSETVQCVTCCSGTIKAAHPGPLHIESH